MARSVLDWYITLTRHQGYKTKKRARATKEKRVKRAGPFLFYLLLLL